MNSGSSVSNLQDKVPSSANRVNLKKWIGVRKSFISNRKRIGSRIEPCGMPDFIGRILEFTH